jgi:hypothetical protein
MLKAHLESEPFPHFEAHPTKPGVLVRIAKDGTRIDGHFVDRLFVPEAEQAAGSKVERARTIRPERAVRQK